MTIRGMCVVVRVVAGALAIAVFGSAVADAQWLQVTVPGTPRTSDGKADLRAATPRTADGKPDLSGIWRITPGQGVLADIAAKVPDGAPLQPWARALHEERKRADGAGRPSERCLPHTIPDAMLVTNFPFKILQTPAVTVILFEEFNNWRQVLTDGRALPKDPEPAWFGYSVGRWDNDVFVVDTIGFKDDGWLDDFGTPHSAAFKTTERVRRLTFGRLEIDFTFDDPKAYTKPWSTTVSFDLLADTELLDHQCDNEKWANKQRRP